MSSTTFLTFLLEFEGKTWDLLLKPFSVSLSKLFSIFFSKAAFTSLSVEFKNSLSNLEKFQSRLNLFEFLPQRVAVKLQVKETVGCVRLARISRVNRLVIVRLLVVGTRIRHTHRLVVVLRHAKSSVVNLAEINSIVISDDNIWYIFFACFALVVLEWTCAALASEIILMLRPSRFSFIEVFAFMLEVASSIRQCVSSIVISKLDMIRRWNRRDWRWRLV